MTRDEVFARYGLIDGPNLRRTGATLMERAGVLPHVIEATLGHTISGVAGVYRRHNFIEEKKAALEGLARLMLDIVGPSPDQQ
jgi:integrase